MTPLLLATAALSAGETPKLAGEARLWLRVPADRNPCSPIVVRKLLDIARDWSDRFGYWDSESNKPLLKQALFE